MTASWILLLALGATEQWADEPVPPPEPPRVSSPRAGLVAGVYVGLPGSFIAPALGTRVGVRLRLGERAALSLFGDLAFAWFDDPLHPYPVQIAPGSFAPAPVILAERLAGIARLELISSSASSVMLVPKLTAGLYFGAGVGLAPGEAAVGLLSGGVHLGITRLEPSGWWFPVFFDLGLQGSLLGGGLGWRLAAGVGI